MIYLLISAIGFFFITKYGSILNLLRTLLRTIPIVDDLFDCALCLGFQVGVLFTIPVYCNTNSIITALLFPFASACLCWFADTVILLLQGIDKVIEKKIKDL